MTCFLLFLSTAAATERRCLAGNGVVLHARRAGSLAAQPRMPPAVSPDMMLRWKIRKNTIVGIAAIADAAMIRFCGVGP